MSGRSKHELDEVTRRLELYCLQVEPTGNITYEQREDEDEDESSRSPSKGRISPTQCKIAQPSPEARAK